MSMSDYLENALLDAVFNNVSLAVTTPYCSLHTADPGETGGNEVSGGSYARQSTSFGAAASGDCATDADVEFTDMPAVTVEAFGFFDASTAGNALWFDWLGNHQWQKFVGEDIAGDVLDAPGHGMSNDDRVVFTAEFGGDTLPAGITAGTLYHVITAATDTFQISTTQGGGAVDYTVVGKGSFRKVEPKTVNSGDSFRFQSGQLTVRAR